jgi:hypothetical protein
MSAEDAVLDYYEALRRGEPLYPYFVESPDTWKAAISTTYEGYDAVAEALREQTRTTEDWVVDSDGPAVVEREDWAAFHDDVAMAWTRTPADDESAATRHEHETRWSGTLAERDGEWLFLELHVSTASAV